MLDKQRSNLDHARVKNATHFHYIFHDGCPSGKIVFFLVGTITSSGFARKQTGLERRAEGTIRWSTDKKTEVERGTRQECGNTELLDDIRTVSELQWQYQLLAASFFSLLTVVMIGTPSSFQFRMNSRSSSIFTCWISLFKFSSVVPVYTQQTNHSENTNMLELQQGLNVTSDIQILFWLLIKTIILHSSESA